MQINADPSSPYNVRIDHDTLGVPGLCDIPATILDKIDSADGFLCDLTYVAATQPEEGGGPRLQGKDSAQTQMFSLNSATHFAMDTNVSSAL